jgi:[acyl-carrier-protein] S-malonyltransferase
MAGHSLGEYTALVCSGSLDFPDAVRLVQRRAELMQTAVPAGKGAMAAVLGLDENAVVEACRNAAEGQIVAVVSFNSPDQIIIAGETAAVGRAVEKAKAAGAKHTLILHVSVPSHSELMHPAAEELARSLADTPFTAPSMPVIGNADVRVYGDAGQIRAGLEKQLYSPVRWTETVRELIARGSSSIVECGPGKVLTGLARRIDRSIPAVCVDARETMVTALAEYAAAPN